MTLPGREDDLLFQKKKSKDDIEFEPTRLLFSDGVVCDFTGKKLPDFNIFINRFLYKTPTISVLIGYQTKDKFWTCSCGGKTLPYHACNHLKNLELSVATGDDVIVLNQQEITSFEENILKDIDSAKLTPDFAKDPNYPLIPPYCVKCGKILPVNTGWCSCGTCNAIYENQLQEIGKSVGVAGTKKYRYKCKSCERYYDSDDFYASCPSCPMAEMQFLEEDKPIPYEDKEPVTIGDLFPKKHFKCDECGIVLDNKKYFDVVYDHYVKDDGTTITTEIYRCKDHSIPSETLPEDNDWWNKPVLNKQGQPVVKPKVKATYRDNPNLGDFRWSEDPKPKENPHVPTMGKKRIFADKDEEV